MGRQVSTVPAALPQTDRIPSFIVFHAPVVTDIEAQKRNVNLRSVSPLAHVEVHHCRVQKQGPHEETARLFNSSTCASFSREICRYGDTSVDGFVLCCP